MYCRIARDKQMLPKPDGHIQMATEGGTVAVASVSVLGRYSGIRDIPELR